MFRSINDYLIDQAGIDWPVVLSAWSWLFPPEFDLWLVNRFADLFIVPPDGTVLMLDVGGGELKKVADSREDFRARMDEGNNADNWLMIPLVDKLAAAGIRLRPGQCYGFKYPPIMGGDYTPENIAPISIPDYLGAYGSIHEQVKDLPDGAKVRLKVVP